MDVCLAARRNLTVKRARFSALTFPDLSRALQRLVPPNRHEAAAVDARQEIDLKIGASFTRFMTMLLQDRVDFSANPDQPLVSADVTGDKDVISRSHLPFSAFV
jgi:DNA topoisomerase III